jgi:hypothetical protein
LPVKYRLRFEIAPVAGDKPRMAADDDIGLHAALAEDLFFKMIASGWPAAKLESHRRQLEATIRNGQS